MKQLSQYTSCRIGGGFDNCRESHAFNNVSVVSEIENVYIVFVNEAHIEIYWIVPDTGLSPFNK